jgi:predicted nucleotidyltransferase
MIDSPQVENIVKQIIDLVKPETIYLFGSAARETRIDRIGDLDFMIVVDESCHRRKTAQFLHKSIIPNGLALDFVVIHPQDMVDSDPWSVVYATHGNKNL